MAITYGGYAFLVPDVRHELSEWIEDHAGIRELQLFSWATPHERAHPHHAPPRIERSLWPTVQRLNWPDPPRLRINSLYVPTGASRWSVGVFLCDGSGVEDLPSTGTLTLTDGGEGSVSYSMYLLAAVPIGRASSRSKQAHLVVLVDRRYYRQHDNASAVVCKEAVTSWQELLTSLDDVLGASPTSAEDDYSPSVEFDSRPDSKHIVYDAAAACVGLRIVPRASSSGYQAQSAAEARTILEANGELKGYISGGDLYGQVRVPSQVAVTFPVFLNEYRPTDDKAYTINISKEESGSEMDLAQVSEELTWTIRCGCLADAQDPACPEEYTAFAGSQSAVKNYADLKAIATTLAKNYYDWQGETYHYVYSGIGAWTLSGFDDSLIYECGAQGPRRGEALNNEQATNTAGYRMQTIVRSLPANFGLADVPAFIDREIAGESSGSTTARWMIQREYWGKTTEQIKAKATGLVRVLDPGCDADDTDLGKIRAYNVCSGRDQTSEEAGEETSEGQEDAETERRIDADTFVLIRYQLEAERWYIVPGGGGGQLTLFATEGGFEWGEATAADVPYIPCKPMAWDAEAESYETTGEQVSVYWPQCPTADEGGYLQCADGSTGLRLWCRNAGTADEPRWEIVDGMSWNGLVALDGEWTYPEGTSDQGMPSATARALYCDSNNQWVYSGQTITIKNPLAAQADDGAWIGLPRGGVDDLYNVRRSSSGYYEVISPQEITAVFKMASSSWTYPTTDPSSSAPYCSANLYYFDGTKYVQLANEYATVNVYWMGAAIQELLWTKLPNGGGSGVPWGIAKYRVTDNKWEAISVFQVGEIYLGTLESAWSGGAVAVAAVGISGTIQAIGWGFPSGTTLDAGTEVFLYYVADVAQFYFGASVAPQVTWRGTLDAEWTKGTTASVQVTLSTGGTVTAYGWGYPSGTTLDANSEVYVYYLASEQKYYFGSAADATPVVRGNLDSTWTKGTTTSVDITLTTGETVTGYGWGYPAGTTLESGAEVYVYYITSEQKYYFGSAMGKSLLLFETTSAFTWTADTSPPTIKAKPLTWNVTSSSYTQGDEVTLRWSLAPRDSAGDYQACMAGASGMRVWASAVPTSDASIRWEVVDGLPLPKLAKLTAAWTYPASGADVPHTTANLYYYDSESAEWQASAGTITIYNPYAPKDSSSAWLGIPYGVAGDIVSVIRAENADYEVTNGEDVTVIFQLISVWTWDGTAPDTGKITPATATAAVYYLSGGSYVSTGKSITVYWVGGLRLAIGTALELPYTMAGAFGTARWSQGQNKWEVTSVFQEPGIFLAVVSAAWDNREGNAGNISWYEIGLGNGTTFEASLWSEFKGKLNVGDHFFAWWDLATLKFYALLPPTTQVDIVPGGPSDVYLTSSALQFKTRKVLTVGQSDDATTTNAPSVSASSCPT